MIHNIWHNTIIILYRVYQDYLTNIVSNICNGSLLNSLVTPYNILTELRELQFLIFIIRIPQIINNN
jgi:hypothetical protein